jgi:Transglycosylase-like domain/LysM domain
LGCHRKPSRIRLPRRLPTVAAPALASVAAAICLSPQALASPSAAPAAAQNAVVAGYQSGSSAAHLLAAEWWAEQAKPAGPSSPSTYRVQPGDSLSSIAGRVYHDQNAWPVLYWDNHKQIHWANVIEAGQVLRIPAKPAKIPAAPGLLGPSALPAPAAAAPAVSDYAPASSASTYSGGGSGGSFGQCVIARESGGNAQVMNASGHYGLYQFSASTWAAYGGNPADFGNASVAEQNQVFANALAAGGQSNWSAYDGC